MWVTAEKHAIEPRLSTDSSGNGAAEELFPLWWASRPGGALHLLDVRLADRHRMLGYVRTPVGTACLLTSRYTTQVPSWGVTY